METQKLIEQIQEFETKNDCTEFEYSYSAVQHVDGHIDIEDVYEIINSQDQYIKTILNECETLEEFIHLLLKLGYGTETLVDLNQPEEVFIQGIN